MSEISEHN